jgi:hypothetical protein
MDERVRDDRMALAAMLATAAAGLMAGVAGYVGVGFLLFIAAGTSLPADAARRVLAPVDRRAR